MHFLPSRSLWTWAWNSKIRAGQSIFRLIVFFNDVDSISILKSRELIFSGIYFSTHLKQDLINVILIISLLH